MDKATQALIERHFDTAFAAPEGIRKLCDFILTLAMQGKLVPQDSAEPPARELLNAIESEKQKLIKERKIKRPKTVPEIGSEDMPYDLPDGWKWSRIGEIGNVFNGNSINAREKEMKYAGAKGLPYIATKDVGYGFDAFNYENGIFIPPTEKKFKIAHRGAVLICAEGGSAGKKCGITDRDICFGNKLFANELFGGIPSKFILYFYLSPIFQSFFSSAMTGIIGGVSIAKFVQLPVPLPPLMEQHRIVTKIDELMTRCDELENLRKQQVQKRVTVHAAAINRLLDTQKQESFTDAKRFITRHFSELYMVQENVGELRKAILQLAIMGKLVPQDPDDPPACELLEEIKSEKQQIIKEKSIRKHKPLAEITPDEIPYPLPHGWEWSRLGDILIFGPTNGVSPKAVDYKTNVRSLTLSATTSGIFKEEHSKYIDMDVPVDSDLWLRDGDILVQRGNTLEYVGVPAVYRGEPNRFIYPDLMMKVRVSSKMDTDYVYLAMSAEPSRNYLRARASGTSGTMPKINQNTLISLPIPIPSPPEQHRIVAKVSELMHLCDALEYQIDASDTKQIEVLEAVMSRV